MSIHGIYNKKAPLSGGAFLVATQACKPGSVLTAIYLALRSRAGSSRLLGTAGSACCPSTALLRIEFTAPQCSHEASALLPHFFTMTGKPATSFCCTCPGVTPGGRYPLSLPCGARTFLIWGLSAPIRGCPAWSRKYCNPRMADCQTSCKFPGKGIYYKKKCLKRGIINANGI